MILSKNKLKYIQSLKEKKYRTEYGVFVAEGNKMVSDLLLCNHCQLLVGTPDYIKNIPNLSELTKIDEIIEVSKNELERISYLKNPQEVFGVFYQPQNILDSEHIKGQLSIALDGIQDPGNMGTIIRLADWFGIEHIICSEDTVDVYNPKVVQATMGALSRVKVYYTELSAWISEVVDEIPIYGTFLNGENLYTSELSESGVIIMGNEGNGIRPEIEKLITNKLLIPSFPIERETSESLNVGVATAIICAEFRRRII